MRLSSVRDLKLELVEPLSPYGGLRPQALPEVSVPAERTVEVGRVHPGIALGIAPGHRSGDYRLAVRIQHRDFVSSSRLNAITNAARGEVDVQYIGLLSKQDEPNRRRRRPIGPGTSIGHFAITAGTLGAFVALKDNGAPHILSNNHVLADENRAAIGDQILQPGVFDGGVEDADRVASLVSFVHLESNRVNAVDAALAVVDSDIDIESGFPGIGNVTRLADVEQVVRVRKTGRTTGLTHGTITAIEVDSVVVRFSTGTLRFDGQIEISGAQGVPFSEGGDSGSLVVDGDDQAAVGLLFAGSDQGGPSGTGVTYVNPMAEVLSKTGADTLL